MSTDSASSKTTPTSNQSPLYNPKNPANPEPAPLTLDETLTKPVTQKPYLMYLVGHVSFKKSHHVGNSPQSLHLIWPIYTCKKI